MMRPCNHLWSLWDMLQLKAHAFLEAYNELARMEQVALQDPEWVFGDDNRRAVMLIHLDALTEQLQILGLNLAIKKAKSIRLAIESVSQSYPANISAQFLNSKMEELRERITDQVEDVFIYVVTPARAKYLKQADRAFGKDVQDKLADASYDLAEAANCLGMARNTACVFHLMRALEFALKKLGKTLAVTVIDKNNKELEWGKIVSNLRDKVEAIPKSDPKRESLSAVISMLFHVKEAWRNSTMHPRQTYTDDEAADIFGATRSFLQSVAKEI